MPVFDFVSVARFALKFVIATGIFSAIIILLNYVKSVLSDILGNAVSGFSISGFDQLFCAIHLNEFIHNFLLLNVVSLSIYVSLSSSILISSYTLKYFDRVFR